MSHLVDMPRKLRKPLLTRRQKYRRKRNGDFSQLKFSVDRFGLFGTFGRLIVLAKLVGCLASFEFRHFRQYFFDFPCVHFLFIYACPSGDLLFRPPLLGTASALTRHSSLAPKACCVVLLLFLRALCGLHLLLPNAPLFLHLSCHLRTTSLFLLLFRSSDTADYFITLSCRGLYSL